MNNPLDSSQLLPDYWDENIIKFTTPEYFRRYDYDGIRFYFKANSNQIGGYDIRWYRGVTSVIGNATTQAELDSLMKWAAEMGEDFDRLRHLPANFGTMMHEFAGLYLMALRGDRENLEIYHNLDNTNSYIDGIISREGWEVPDAIKEKWYKRAKHNMLCIKRFCDDYNVVPIAIELPVTNDEMGLAGTVDAIVKMTIEEKGFWGEVYKSGENKGQPKETKREREIYAIVDFKFPFGDGIYHKYAVQLELYKLMVEQAYDIKIEKIYNLRPMNTSKSYNYGLVDQTNKVDMREIDALMMLAEIRMPFPYWEVDIIKGIMRPDATIEDLVKKMDINEYLISQYTNYNSW